MAGSIPLTTTTSLLQTLEAGFCLPCLNHACDPTSVVMNPMFGGPTFFGSQ
jgi:hypothetical protein